MERTINRQNLWEEGARGGLILGLFTGVFIFLGMGTNAMSAGSAGMKMLAVALSAGLWLVKFIGCLWLIRFFMLKFAAGHPDATGSHTFRTGAIVALTSAIVYSGIQLFYMCVIAPDTVRSAIDTMMEMYKNTGMFGEGEMLQMERILRWYPQISFFTNLIYCTIYGVIVSRIFSGSIPQKDIFGGRGGNSPDGNTSAD